MTKVSSAEPVSSDCHREADVVGRGDPAPRQALGIEHVETAGLLRRSAPRNDKSALTLWLWVTGAFLLLAVAWVVMFTAARAAKIESVPRATSGGGTR